MSATSEGKTGTATVTILQPVATVSLDKGTATLVPGQTSLVTVTTKAANGDILANRPVSWTSSAATVATVSTTGLVTAVIAGAATITATAEGKSATMDVPVIDGGIVNSNGVSTITGAGGAVTISVPAGAAPADLAISVVPVTTVPAPLPTTDWRMGTTLYKLGPDGTQFSAPVTVTLTYEPATLPA